jgi:hypothetical protein
MTARLDRVWAQHRVESLRACSETPMTLNGACDRCRLQRVVRVFVPQANRGAGADSAVRGRCGVFVSVLRHI